MSQHQSKRRDGACAPNLAGWLDQTGIRQGMVTANDPAATAHAITAHQHLFRLGFAAAMITNVIALPLTLILYRRLAPASRCWLPLAVMLDLTQNTINAMNAWTQFAPLTLLNRSPAPSRRGDPGLQTQTYGKKPKEKPHKPQTNLLTPGLRSGKVFSMDGRTPSAALGANSKTAAPEAPSANQAWDAIVTRSDNPIKRAMDVTCVILIQLLILLVLGDEKYRDQRRDCYVLAPDSILSRLEQGDDFGLPLPMAASIRLIVRLLRTQYNLGQDYIDSLTAPDPDAAPVLLPSPRGRGWGRGPRRMAPRPSHHTLRHVGRAPAPVFRSLATPIPLGHHPPPRPNPLQKPLHPNPQKHALFVTVSQRIAPCGLPAGPTAAVIGLDNA